MLTDAKIKAAIRAVTTEITLNDKIGGRGHGSLILVVRRLSDGSVSALWYALAKRDGKRTKKSLGRYPDMTLAMARQTMAAEISPALASGKSLKVAYVGDKPTVERMFQAYADHMKAEGKASADEVERQLLKAKNNAADILGRNRLASEVEPHDVADLVAEFFNRGTRGAADKVRSYVQSAYNWAIKSAHDYTVESRQDWGVTVNPAAAVPRDRKATKARERNLDVIELRALWHAAAPGENGFTLETAACVRLLIATGQRVTSVLRMEGRELDLDAAVWRMPKHKTKTGRDHGVPLPGQVIPLLRDLVAKHGEGWLFPGRVDAQLPYMDHRSIMQSIDRWLALPDVDVANFQTRDIRRTWKSRAGEEPVSISREMRDLIQMHAKNDTGSKHYDWSDYLPAMREAMDRWELWLENNVVNPPQNNSMAA